MKTQTVVSAVKESQEDPSDQNVLQNQVEPEMDILNNI